jgi:hypothetical protein
MAGCRSTGKSFIPHAAKTHGLAQKRGRRFPDAIQNKGAQRHDIDARRTEPHLFGDPPARE